MNYPASPGFQSHSETSRAAAAQLSGQGLMQRKALEFIVKNGGYGATIDEIAVFLSDAMARFIPPGTASARMIELERAGKIFKTAMKRKTRAGRSAFVYVGPGQVTQIWIDEASKITEDVWNKAPMTTANRITGYKDQLSHRGHGYVVPRADGKKEKCGGPSICRVCRQEEAYLDHVTKSVVGHG